VVAASIAQGLSIEGGGGGVVGAAFHAEHLFVWYQAWLSNSGEGVQTAAMQYRPLHQRDFAMRLHTLPCSSVRTEPSASCTLNMTVHSDSLIVVIVVPPFRGSSMPHANIAAAAEPVRCPANWGSFPAGTRAGCEDSHPLLGRKATRPVST
jgi:hypothetical protein